MLRYCIPPVLLLVLLTIWHAHRREHVSEKVEVSEFDDCIQAIEAAGVPSSEQLGVLEHVSTNSSEPSTFDSRPKGEDHRARVISPSDLMAMLDRGEPLTGRILHQSWKDHQLPDHFERWSKEWQGRLDQSWLCVTTVSKNVPCIAEPPRCSYVLWTDEDNRKLVESYYNEYLEAYDRLPREIYRADMVSATQFCQ